MCTTSVTVEPPLVPLLEHRYVIDPAGATTLRALWLRNVGRAPALIGEVALTLLAAAGQGEPTRREAFNLMPDQAEDCARLSIQPGEQRRYSIPSVPFETSVCVLKVQDCAGEPLLCAGDSIGPPGVQGQGGSAEPAGRG